MVTVESFRNIPWTYPDIQDTKNESTFKPFCEVQAVLLAHHSTYSMHPLLQRDNNTGKERAKFLLPFGNRPIITYPLRLLQIHGFREILVVITEDFVEEMMNFLSTYKHYSFHDSDDEFDEAQHYKIKPVTVSEEDLGEISVLREIHEHIKTDFILIRCDIFTNAPLRELLHIHRRENASITLLLSKQSDTMSNDKNGKPQKKKKKSKNTHIIGTDRNFHKQSLSNGHCKEIERLWFMKSRADLEDEDNKNEHDESQLELSKSLLDYIGNLRFCTKYKVPQIGIFCKWILLWIIEEAPSKFDLLYEEAVPFLIEMQNEINCKQSKNTIASSSDLSSAETTDTFSFPDLIRRASTQNLVEENSEKKPLKKVESKYASGLFLDHPDVLGNDYIKSTAASSAQISTKDQRRQSPLVQRISSLPSPVNLAQSDDENVNDGMVEDKLKVFGYVFCSDNDNGKFSQIIDDSDTFLSLSMSLINSIKMVQQKENQSKNTKNASKKKHKKKQQKVVENVVQMNEERKEFEQLREFEDNGMLQLIFENNVINEYMDDSSIKIKNGCVLSPNCTIGTKTKIDKCILEPFVTIGKNCKIDNCVIFEHVTIGDHCKISNSIISTYANIGEKCVIHHCKVAERANITKGEKYKNETLSCRVSNNDFDEIAMKKLENVNENNNNDDDNIINID